LRAGGKHVGRDAYFRFQSVVRALADALQDDDARVRVIAAAHILDRLYGRPAQATGLTLKAEAIDASAAHLTALVAAARRRDPRIIQ